MVITFYDWNEYEHDDYSLSDSYSIVYRSLLKMGLSNTPKNLRKRIAFFSVLFGGMVTYYLWEAMLISYFSSPKTSLPFDSLQGFLSHSDKKLMVVKGTAYEYYFRNAANDDLVRQKIWKERMEPY